MSEASFSLLSPSDPSNSLGSPVPPPLLRGDSGLQKPGMQQRGYCPGLEGKQGGRKVVAAAECIYFDPLIPPDRISRSVSVTWLLIIPHHSIAHRLESQGEF